MAVNVQLLTLVRWVNFVIALLLVWFLAKAILQFWQSEVAAKSILMPVLTVEDPMMNANATQNLTGSLFGRLQQEPKSSSVSQPVLPSPSVETLQKTRLNLTLKGTLVTPARSVALIEKGREVLVLTVGESVSRAVTLQAIEETFVVLENKGVLEKLALPGVEVNASGSAPSAQIHSAALSSTQQDKLEEVRRKVKASPLALNRYIRIRTIQSQGKIQSLQLWPRREKAIFEALGFRAGDRLMAINGQSIAELAADMSQWQSMMNLSQAQFSVKRNGVMQTIDVNLQ